MPNLTAPTRKPIRLAPVHPNAGLRAAYQRRLAAAIDAMARAVQRHIAATYRANPPELAADEYPATALREAIERLAIEWEGRFADLANTAGHRFARNAVDQADRQFSASLKRAGFTVRFKATRAVQDVLRATMAEQVSLIKSIPAQYFTQVQSLVTESVTVGRDLGALAKGLEHQLGVTKRRAALIARDQNNKATASITRVRQQELGITQAVWMHSAAGKEPRQTHIAMNGKTYEVSKGMWDSAEQKFIWPGVLINCRCVARAVIPGVD